MLRSIVLATAAIAVVAQAPIIKKSIPLAVTKSAKTKQENKAIDITKKPSDIALAKIGNEIIYQSDFELFLQNILSDQQRAELQYDREAKDQLLNDFLKLKTMVAKAQNEGLQKKFAYTSKIAIARMQILAQNLMERDLPGIDAKAIATDEEIKIYFNANQGKFQTPEMFSARHILVSNKNANNESKPSTDEEIKAKIAKIQDKLKNGRNFVDIAKEYSDDPGSKDKGGLYENVIFGQFAKEFEQAVRSQEIDKVGEPIKTQYGYHLIEVKKITPAIAKTFEESKGEIKAIVTAEHKKIEVEKYFDRLKRETGYKKFD